MGPNIFFTKNISDPMTSRLPFTSIPPKEGFLRDPASWGPVFPPKYFGPNDAAATLLVHYPKYGPWASFGTILAQEGPGVIGPKMFPPIIFPKNVSDQMTPRLPFESIPPKQNLLRDPASWGPTFFPKIFRTQ